jgi:hypothetical protein
MRTKLFFILSVFLCTACCQKDEKPSLPPYDAARPTQSDRKPNGGLLRFTLDGKLMHDSYFEAQFTPRGDVFQFDNLQMYNYNLESEKYPRILISIDHAASDLKQWSGLTVPMDFMAFTPTADTAPLAAHGEINIKSADEHKIEGSFTRELVHPVNGRTFPMSGEFRAIVKLNI